MKEYGELSDCEGMNDRLFKAGQLVRHFKGGLYRILAPVALHTDDYTAFVVYEEESFDTDGMKNGKVWVRPLEEFCSEVDKEKYPNATQKYRFEIVGR